MEAAVERLQHNAFEVRDKLVQRPNVRDGMLIKVGIRGERFWCRVKRIRGDGALIAVVDNDLIRSHWRCGDEIVVQNNHVLETSDPKDMTFASLLATLGSAKDAAMVWRELRLADGSGVKAKPATFFVLPDNY
jgi:hypothetical protein